jgi:lipopolysaccharide transport system ATP-binding protein
MIEVRNLGKRYRRGGKHAVYRTLREDLLRAMTVGFIGRRDRSSTNESFWALHDVSLTINEGEVVGIIGRNGAGKSTLLKVLSRITKPTEGQAKLYGRVGALLEVGTGFHQELTGRENVFLAGTILGMRRSEVKAKFDEIIAFSEMEDFLDTPVKHYSSGMSVRLAFSVAAHLEPEIMLIDEVLAVGDASFQKKCLGKMSQVALVGRTILFVSHNMEAIQRLCSRAILFEKGCISFDGNPREAVDRYLGDEDERLSVEFPENPSVAMKLRRLTLLDAEGKPAAGSLETSDGIRVRVEYDINRPVKGAQELLQVMDGGGVLLSTSDADTAPERLEGRPPGRYSAIVEIPPRLLGSGYYSLTCNMGVPFQVDYDPNYHVLAFRVVDNRRTAACWRHYRPTGRLGLELSWIYSEGPFVT